MAEKGKPRRWWVARLVDAFAEREMRHRMRAHPLYALAELPEDTLGRVCGAIAPFGDEVLVAPLSGRSCVYYHVVVDVLRGATWDLEEETLEQGMSFVLDDRGARAVVDPQHATVSAEYDYIEHGRKSRPSKRAKELVARLGLYAIQWSDMRLREAVLGVGEVVAVVGAGVREADPDAGPAAGYREAGATRLRLTGTKRFPLAISDDPRVLY